MLLTCCDPEQRQRLPFFANPSQVVRKFAKKGKCILREVAKKLRRKMGLSPAKFSSGKEAASLKY
jgi:hypothetical protein